MQVRLPDDPKFMDTDVRVFIYTMCACLTGMTILILIHTSVAKELQEWAKIAATVNSIIRIVTYIAITWGAGSRNRQVLLVSNALIAILVIADMEVRVATLVKLLCLTEEQIKVFVDDEYADLKSIQTSATVLTGVIQAFLLFCHIPLILACAIFHNHLKYHKELTLRLSQAYAAQRYENEKYFLRSNRPDENQNPPNAIFEAEVSP